jgi:hypothetical protein
MEGYSRNHTSEIKHVREFIKPVRHVPGHFQQLLISGKCEVVFLKILLKYGHSIQLDNATMCDLLI